MTRTTWDLANRLAAAVALVLLAPVLLVIAAWIRLADGRGVLFVQDRAGRDGVPFRMLKFRTMVHDSVRMAEEIGLADPFGLLRDDPRITRCGRFLRRTSLDELPQLINVVKGEMSIVGPRPHALGSTAEEAPFWVIDDRYWDRHAIKPGMTGLAQVRGFRGATERRSDLTDRLKADLEYLDGWSVGRDLAIIARTLSVMVHRNAY